MLEDSEWTEINRSSLQQEMPESLKAQQSIETLQRIIDDKN